MMNAQTLSSLFITIISIWLRTTDAALCQQTIEYIDGKLRNTKVAIAKSSMQDEDSAESVKYDISPAVLWHRDLDNRALTIGLLDEMFVLIEKDRTLSSFTQHPDRFPTTTGLHEIPIPRSETPMSFQKSIIWKDTTYLLICYYSDFCNVHTDNGSREFHYQQRLRNGISRPTDAKFFVDNDQLYLIIATNLEPYASPSTIYRWTGTYMDVIAEVDLKSVISVDTFNHKGSRVLIFSQNGGSRIFKLIINAISGHGHLEVSQFLPTNRPAAMHLYNQRGCTFLLVVNQEEPSQVFWWDGTEFLPWMQIDGIRGYGLLNSIQIAVDTFFFIAQGNCLSLYKVTSSNYELLHVFKIPDIVKIVDIGVWSDGNTISIVFISEIESDRYRVEPWRLIISKLENAGARTKAVDEDLSNGKCLRSLVEKLKQRTKKAEEMTSLWKDLYPASGDVEIDKLEADVILRSVQASSVIDSLEIISDPSEEIHFPADMEISKGDLESRIDETLDKSRNLVMVDENTKKLVLPSLTITNDAKFDHLDTSELETNLLNGENPSEHLRKAISAKGDQVFNETLRGKNVIIQNLQVDSLCGVPSDFWLLKSEISKTPLKPTSGPANLQIQIQIKDDTVVINSDIFLPKFVTKVLNSVNLTNFLDNLFIRGENQVINGDVSFEVLFVNNLILEELDGVPTERLLTVTTDQNIDHAVQIGSLYVKHLRVNKINGVRPSEAAKLSQENVIKGKVIINHLRITDELIIDDKCDSFKKAEHKQIYEDVTIIGNVTVGRLYLEKRADLQLDGIRTRGHDIDRLIAKSWTKSTNQTITAPSVTFLKGLTIDELNTEYLNGMGINEYLYTTVESIPADFGHLHFEDFVVNGTILRENNTRGFVEITNETVVFNERIYFKELNASNIVTTAYNGIPIASIYEPMDPETSIQVSIPDDLTFERIIVNGDLQVGDIRFQSLNGHNVSSFLFLDQDHKVENVTTAEFRVSDYRSSSGAFRRRRAVDEISLSDPKNVVIHGRLIVESLDIAESINGQSVDEYLDALPMLDIRIDDPNVELNELNVLGDVTVGSLQNVDFEKFIDNVFSKTKDQTLIGPKSFHRVTVDNIDARVINGKTIEEMYFVHDDLIFEGDVTFTDLSADVDTPSVNDINSDWIQNDRVYIPSRRIKRMDLTGAATWENASKNRKTLSDIIENAVRINSDDVIAAPVDFSGVQHVQASSVYTQHPVNDTILGNSKAADGFGGTETFLGDIVVHDLTVDDLEIGQLVSTTIRELNSSIVRKDESTKMITGTCKFLDETSVIDLESADLGPGMPNISSLYLYSENEDNPLPNGTYFNHLVIKKAAEVSSLDGVDMNKFLKERITLSGNHVITSRVRLNGQTRVLENIEVERVNGRSPSDIVLRDSPIPQVITDSKTFDRDLEVEMDFDAPLFNTLNMTEAYKNGVFIDEPATIKGDLVIEGNITLWQDFMVDGKINQKKFSSLLQDFENTTEMYLENMTTNMNLIDDLLSTAANVSTEQQLFHHLEFQQNIEIPGIRSVDRVISLVRNDTTRVFVYARISGKNCTLSEDCSCKRQYTIDFIKNQFVFNHRNTSRVYFFFPDPNEQFLVFVRGETISSSPRCSLAPGTDNATLLSWGPLYPSSENLQAYSDDIFGHLSDAQVLFHQNFAYIVLAISYDVTGRSHQSDSLIYKLDLENNEVELEMGIPMNSATAVAVFEIPGKGSYVLIAAGASADPGDSAKSVLYRMRPAEDKFELMKSFYTGGTRKVRHLAYRHEDFIIMDDLRTKVVHIYKYRESFDDFYLYQSLLFSCDISDVEVFYAGDVRSSDAFILISTENRFHMYQYMMVGKFQERMSKAMQGVLSVTPFSLPEGRFLLLVSKHTSSIFRVVSENLP